MKVSVEQTYTSVACNRAPEIVDWNSDGLLCFGACNAVAIYDTKLVGKDPHTILSHHKARINCVKWLIKADGTSTELVSCSADKTASIWSLVDGVWKLTSSLEGHSNAVTCVCGLYDDDDTLLVYTAAVDSTIRVWERKDGKTSLRQVINLNSGLCLTLYAYLLPSVNKPVLLCALDDHKIHVFVDDGEYHRTHTLAGHEDWVRGLDCLTVDPTTILLASCSQDTYIRIWRIQKHEPNVESNDGVIKAEEKVFRGYGHVWSVKLDAVLAGHEGWVYGVQWHPYNIDTKTDKKQPVFRLLSSSLDKTVIIWEPSGRDAGGGAGDAGGGAWEERVRVGEVGGGGLGFYGSRFGPRGEAILAHGYNGSFHIWELDKSSGAWTGRAACGGHFAGAADARWEPRGRYLVSVAADQTTRLHAPADTPRGRQWHEVGRPQVHGYDLCAVCPLSGTVLVSAADEKVLRVFRAPRGVRDNLRRITGEDIGDGDTREMPEGAAVPSLGLSNKAVFCDDSLSQDTDEDNDADFAPEILTEPPTEEHLSCRSLWAEHHKLYGHGHAAAAAAASRDATLLASAARATTPAHAAVLLWDTSNWQQIQKLSSHQLTVTQLQFSPDSQRLLSVSRDRRWTVFQRRQGLLLFDLAATTDKTNGVHTRIIWSCAWAHDGEVFATGSRDGKVCVWTSGDTDTSTSLGVYRLLRTPLHVPSSSVTAVTFAPLRIDGARVVVTGFESGVIRIYSFGEEWSLLTEMDTSLAHHLTVKRLEFRPTPAPADTHEHHTDTHELASCGDDHLVRIYTLTFT